MAPEIIIKGDRTLDEEIIKSLIPKLTLNQAKELKKLVTKDDIDSND